MVDVWPVSLPQQILMEGNADGSADGRIRSQPSAGPSIVRRRFSAAVRPMSGRMYMTTAQIATLRTFVDTTTLNGSLPFNFKDPINDAVVLARFADQLPRWINVSGNKYEVMLQLEILP